MINNMQIKLEGKGSSLFYAGKSYLNELSRTAKPSDPDDCTVQHVAKIIAWECLKSTYHTAPAWRDSILAATINEADQDRAGFPFLGSLRVRTIQ
jgi:hypothetical protein